MFVILYPERNIPHTFSYLFLFKFLSFMVFFRCHGHSKQLHIYTLCYCVSHVMWVPVVTVR